ncbi:MAG: hypothetical protein ACI3ZP_01730 [Candidatus Cryptobacteroides sp.]
MSTPSCPNPNTVLSSGGRFTPLGAAWHIMIPIVAMPIKDERYFDIRDKSNVKFFIYSNNFHSILIRIMRNPI